MGRRQVVRQWILIPPCGGSNPPAPANKINRLYRLARDPEVACRHLVGTICPKKNVAETQAKQLRRLRQRSAGADCPCITQRVRAGVLAMMLGVIPASTTGSFGKD